MLGYLRAVLERIGLGHEGSAGGDGTDEAESADEDTGSVWDFIPGRQYSGRHAEPSRISSEKPRSSRASTTTWIPRSTGKSSDSGA